MPGLTVKQQIAASPERVFEVLSDLRTAADRITKITKVEVLTDGPIGVGTRFRETRIMFKREATETMEIVAFEPGKRIAMRAENHGCIYNSEFRMRPEAGGTELEFVFEAEALTRMAKIMSKLMMPLMKKAMIKECSSDLDDIRRACEAGAT